jgi:hypothetical protein
LTFPVAQPKIKSGRKSGVPCQYKVGTEKAEYPANAKWERKNDILNGIQRKRSWQANPLAFLFEEAYNEGKINETVVLAH